MRKHILTIAFSLVFLLQSVAMAFPGHASSVGFSMTPVLPANQRSNVKSYFDLDVEPGQVQVLSVTVSNKSDEDIAVLMETYEASTNMNGEINYAQPSVLDESLVHPFSKMVTLEEDRIIVSANSEAIVNLTVKFPEEKFDGIILGSIRALKELTEEEKNSGQMLVNQFAYTVAVKAQQNDELPPVDFAMGDVVAELQNYRAAIVCNIRNPQPVVIKGASVAARIYPQGDAASIMELANENVDFAPNSVFPFFLVDKAGYGLQPGQYSAKVDVSYNGKDWNFEEDFEIKAEEAAEINQTAVNQVQQRQTASGITGLSTWAMIALIVGGLLLLAIIVLLVMVIRKKR